MVLLLYVDDMLVTVSSPNLLSDFIFVLKSEFAMSDLGFVHYLLGIEITPITPTPRGLFLSQQCYIQQLLDRAKVTDCKPISTPIVVSKTKTEVVADYADPSHYRMLVGSLQYLTITRPDIAYAANDACQHMQTPNVEHFQMMKRILSYLKATITVGHYILADSSLSLSAFSDSDWAGCKETRRSTTDFCTRIGENLISWTAKK